MVEDSCHTADVRVRRGHFQFQKGDLIGNPVVAKGFAVPSAAAQLAKALIGAPIAKMRLRGLYCIVPLPAEIQFKALARPHIESHPTQLVLLSYLEDVPAGAGGLYVWPGSHRDIYPAMASRLEHVATPRYEDVFRQWAGLQPLEVPGKRGDVVIIHHRLLHSPSLNRSEHIRYAFLCDYHREDFRTLCQLEPSEDIWEDWPAIRALPSAIRDAPSDFQLKAQEGLVETTPIHSSSYKLSIAHSKTTDPSNVRKADASALARSRRAGDIWLLISDQPSSADDWELNPRGSTWNDTSLRVKLNGEPVTSVCHYDHIARLEVRPGTNVVEVDGVDRPAWLRVLKVRLPFVDTEFLIKASLTPGSRQLEINVPTALGS